MLAYALLALLSQPSAQLQKLSGPMAVSSTGHVSGVRLGPVSERALFLHEPDPGLGRGLYVVPVDGSAAALRLDDALANRDVERAEFTPAGSRVVYLEQDRSASGAPNRLFGVPTNRSSAPVPLSPALAADRDVTDFALAPGSQWVLYVASPSAPDLSELFRVAVTGGAALSLSGTLPAGTQLLAPVASPDGVHALYLASSANTADLHAVRLDGSAPPDVVNGPLPVGGRVTGFRASPDGTRVVYRADQDLDERFELYVVQTDGTQPPVRLSGPMVAGGNVNAFFRIAPDGLRVIYLADALLDGKLELFSVPIDGSTPPLRLNGPLANGGDVLEAEFDPTSGWVVYRAREGGVAPEELFAVRADASTPAGLLSSALAPSESVLDWLVSTDGTAVVYRTREDSGLASGLPDAFRLWRVATDASQPADELFSLTGFSEPATPLLVTPDFARVLVGQGVDGFWSVSADGSGPAERLDPAEAPHGSAPVTLAAFGEAVLIVAAQSEADASGSELFAAPVDGSVAPTRLSPQGTASVSGDVTAMLVSPDGTTLVYLADQDVGGRYELYRVPTDGSLAPVRVNLPLATGTDVLADFLRFTSDSRRILFHAQGLYGAPLDGSELPVLLTDASLVRIELAGDRVVYLASAGGVDELFSVPVGGGTSVRLNAPLAPDRDVRSFLVAPDGSFVVYLADQDVADRFEFYRVASAGGPVVRLDDAGAWPSKHKIYSYQLGRDGQDVVFRFGFPFVMDANYDITDLYSLPTSGGSPRVRLTSFDTATLTGSPMPWYESAGLGRVVVWLEGDLYTVSVRGGASPALLHPPLAAGRDVSSVGLVPNGTRAVYLADANSADVEELFSVPVDGSAAPSLLSGALVAGGDVQSWRVSPDGAQVVFGADAVVDGIPSTLVVPIGGGVAPLLLRHPGGGYEISADSQRLVYANGAGRNLSMFSLPLNLCTPSKRLIPVPHGPDLDVTFSASVASAHRFVFVGDLDEDGVQELYASVDEAGALAVEPPIGSAFGGETVTIHGVGFNAATRVWFGARAAIDVVLVDDHTLSATVPPRSFQPTGGTGRVKGLPPRTVAVRVGDCGTTTTLLAAYTYR